MSIHTIYRIGIWLPLAVPTLVAGLVHGLGVAVGIGAHQKVVQILLISLLYGAVPYALLALWATWWVGGRSELLDNRCHLSLWLCLEQSSRFRLATRTWGWSHCSGNTLALVRPELRHPERRLIGAVRGLIAAAARRRASRADRSGAVIKAWTRALRT